MVLKCNEINRCAKEVEIILAKPLGVPHWGQSYSFIVWGKVTAELCLAPPSQPGATLSPMSLTLLSYCSSFCAIIWSLFLEPSIALGKSVCTASSLLCLHWSPAFPSVVTSLYVALSQRFLLTPGSPHPLLECSVTITQCLLSLWSPVPHLQSFPFLLSPAALAISSLFSMTLLFSLWVCAIVFGQHPCQCSL